MRVATTYDNGNIFMHFGRSEQFKVYDIQDGKVLNEQVVGTGSTGHGALAGLLANGGVDTLCGGIGGGAINALPKPASRCTQELRAAATLVSRPLSPERSHRTARPRAAATAMTTTTPTNMASPAVATAITTMMDTRAAAATSGKPARQDASAPIAITCKQTAKAAWDTIQAAFAIHISTSRYFLLRICASIWRSRSISDLRTARSQATPCRPGPWHPDREYWVCASSCPSYPHPSCRRLLCLIGHRAHAAHHLIHLAPTTS